MGQDYLWFVCAPTDGGLAEAPSLQIPGQKTTTVVGVGPMPEPWPDDPRLDRELLASGDRRNVIDRYRYWTMEAIVADLDTRRSRLHVAIQTGSTTSTSVPWCAPQTPSTSRLCTFWDDDAGTDAVRW